MAAFTAASTLEDVGYTTTYDTPYTGGGYTITPVPFTPDHEGFGTTTGPTSRTGYGTDDAGFVSITLPSRLGHTLSATQVVGGLDPEAAGMAPRATVARSAPATFDPKDGVVATSTTLAAPSSPRSSPTYSGTGFGDQTVGGLNPEDGAAGAVIPTSYFRKATGKALDQNGDPIPGGLYVLALDNFATVGPVEDDGSFEIYLLKQAYSTFILVGDQNPDEEEGYDLVWYELAGNPDLASSDNYVELQFEVKKPQPADDVPSGVNLASDLSFG